MALLPFVVFSAALAERISGASARAGIDASLCEENTSAVKRAWEALPIGICNAACARAKQ